MYVCVCPRSYLLNCTPNLIPILCIFPLYIFSVLLWRRSGMLRTSGVMGDVIFAPEPRLLDVAAQLMRSVHAALGLAINCAQ